MRTSVRDLAGFALRSLPPRARLAERDRGIRHRNRARLRQPSRRTRAGPPRGRRPEEVPARRAALARSLLRRGSDVEFEEAHAVLACLAGLLAGSGPKAAAAALAKLVHRRGLERAGQRGSGVRGSGISHKAGSGSLRMAAGASGPTMRGRTGRSSGACGDGCPEASPDASGAGCRLAAVRCGGVRWR